MAHAKTPGEAHHALLRDLTGVTERFGANGMPPVERIAVLAQLIGHELRAVPAGQYSAAEVLTAVAFNIEAGNKQ